MRLPEEFVAKEIIPYIRSKLVHHLFKNLKISQREIAALLWIRQPTVSKILSKPPEEGEMKNYFSSKKIESFIRNAAKNLLSRQWNANDFIISINQLIWKSLMGGELCHYHKSLYPELKQLQCDACFRLFESLHGTAREREEKLQALRQCYLTLKKFPEIVSLIPEVRTNIVIATSDSRSTNDIAAFPGRITVHHNTLQTLDEPEFGASKHLGSILLKARFFFKNIECATCIRHSPQIISILRKMNHKIESLPRTDAYKGNFLSMFNDVFQKMKEQDKKAPLLVFDPGTLGFEPVIYIFHEDLSSLTELLISVATKINKKQERMQFP